MAEVALSDDAGCASCQGCIAAAGSCEIKTVKVINEFNHKVGDAVDLELPSGHYYKAFFFVFFLPLFLLLFTIMLLQALKVESGITVLIAFIVFISSYYFANIYDKKIKQITN